MGCWGGCAVWFAGKCRRRGLQSPSSRRPRAAFDKIERVHALEQLEGVCRLRISSRHITCLDELLITRVPRIVHVYGISVESTAAGVENGQRRNVCAVVKGRQGAQIKGSGGGSANRTTALIIGATWFLKDLGCERFRGRHAAWVGWVAVADGIFVHVCACNLSAVWFKMWDSV